MVDAAGYTVVVTTQIAIRLDDDELASLDAEVAQGHAANRSEAVRHALARLQREQRYQREEATLAELVRRGEAVYTDFDSLLDPPHPALD